MCSPCGARSRISPINFKLRSWSSIKFSIFRSLECEQELYKQKPILLNANKSQHAYRWTTSFRCRWSTAEMSWRIYLRAYKSASHRWLKKNYEIETRYGRWPKDHTFMKGRNSFKSPPQYLLLIVHTLWTQMLQKIDFCPFCDNAKEGICLDSFQ